MSTEKATGFMTIGRQGLTERPPQERIQDWQELYIPLPVAQLQQQGQRCMDCGVPFCHTGKVLNNMASGCPLHNLIPEWNDLVYRGLWREAYERLDKTNNFPEFTGRVCPAPCEAACVLGINQPAVTIKNIENAIIDRAFAEGWVIPNEPEKRTGKKVAVIGSGPAGLACADQLNKVGHQVTVYERAPLPGGLMTYGIPNMKIEKETVLRRIDLLKAAGIEFICNTEVGVDIAAEELRNQYDAMVLCGGATKPNDFFARTPGRNLDGIHFAMAFLTANTQSLIDSQLADGNYISAEGKNVLVIGGGDTGTDCVGTSIRHGCASVAQFEIMDRPPNERAANNPWPQWPKVYMLDYGQKEAKSLYGEDPREYAIFTKEFVGDENGRVKAVRTVQIQWEVGERGRRFTEIEGTEKEWPAELVLFATGFRGPEDPLLDGLGVQRDARSNAMAHFNEFATNQDGVFTAGDMRRGQSLVVWAIHEGRSAAREVDRYLMGETDLL